MENHEQEDIGVAEEEVTVAEAPALPDLSSIPAGFNKGVSDYFNHFVMVADAKAGACLAADLAIVVAVVSFEYSSPLTRLLLVLALISFGLSGIACGAVIFPRLPRGSNGVIFWEDIRSFPSLEAYFEKLSTLTEETITKGYAEQNYLVSNVLHKKHYWLQRGIALFGIGVAISLLTYLLLEVS
ncbi:MAG: Pycsar system effector family protein [Candidatus Promineifilaceae bacterium]